MKIISQKAIFVSALLAGVLTAGVPTTAMTVKATEQTATVKQDIKATPFQVKILQEKLDLTR